MAKVKVEITETYMYVLEFEVDKVYEVRDKVYETDSIINRNRDELDELGTINTMFDYNVLKIETGDDNNA